MTAEIGTSADLIEVRRAAPGYIYLVMHDDETGASVRVALSDFDAPPFAKKISERVDRLCGMKGRNEGWRRSTRFGLIPASVPAGADYNGWPCIHEAPTGYWSVWKMEGNNASVLVQFPLTRMNRAMEYAEEHYPEWFPKEDEEVWSVGSD